MKTYIHPEMTVVRLQHGGTICTSPNGYDGNTIPVPSGEGTIGNEGDVWTKENKNYNLWDDEW